MFLRGRWAIHYLALIVISICAPVLAAGATGSTAQSSGSALAQTRQGEQTASRNAVPSAVFERVRRAIARYFGIRVEEISPQTNLEEDLYAEPMDVVDVLAILAEEYGLEPPARSDLVTVQAIADYLAERIDTAKTQSKKQRGIFSPAPSPPEKERIFVQRIFYATNRKPTGDRDPNYFYSGERAVDPEMSYGICEVTIPVLVHKKGHEERPGLFRLEWRENPAKHIVLQRVLPLGNDQFLTELNEQLGDSNEPAGQDVVIFIHGYNTTFANAARRTAQIAYDLDLAGVPILFSWPSDGTSRAYLSDREDVEWSVPHMEQFINELVARSGAQRLQLIAHSMGSQVLIRTLYQIALQRGPDAPPLFENVILAAPDFDAQRFTEQLAPQIVSLARHWTLYASDKDIALKASEALAAKRLGLPLPLVAGVDTVDASGIEVTPWSLPERHAYYASKQRVIDDLIDVLRDRAPKDRHLVRHVKAGLVYWSLAPAR
jgi:acyl carrier protein